MNFDKAKTPTTLEKFANDHRLALEVRERNLPTGHPAKYYAFFSSCAIVDEPPLLRTAFGNGLSPKLAIDNYAEEIQLKTIVIVSTATAQEKRYLRVPQLIQSLSEEQPRRQ